jgi:hypothetical protein
LTGNMNTRVGNKATNTVITNGEAAVKNSLWQKHKTDSEQDSHAQIEYFALNC